jgi:hypothetical protein
MSTPHCANGQREATTLALKVGNVAYYRTLGIFGISILSLMSYSPLRASGIPPEGPSFRASIQAHKGSYIQLHGSLAGHIVPRLLKHIIVGVDEAPLVEYFPIHDVFCCLTFHILCFLHVIGQFPLA